VATPQGDYQATLRTIADLVAGVERLFGTTGTVGVGTPGSLSRVTGRLKNCNSVWLNDQPLCEDLASLLHRPVRVSNDANCFALSEATDGAARGARVVFGVIIGTGTGAGIVVGGQVLDGPNGIAGEWGHNPLPWPADDERPGPRCYCGRHGCIETFISGPGMAADHARATGVQRSAADIVSVATTVGEPDCTATLHRYTQRLSRALAHVINVLDPDVIVLGGGMSNIASLYSTIPALWGAYVFSDRVDTRLVPPVHGDSSGVRGAAWLWNEQE
jgi:fructokinase